MKREEEAAFESFVRTAGTSLMRTAMLLTGDRSKAEDALQVALERTARKWTSISGEPAAYARKVLSNAVVDGHRLRWPRREALSAVDPDSPSGDFADEVVAREDLSRLLLKLSKKQRAVLVLRFYNDLSEVEVAQTLGISAGTVKSATSRGLARLRELSTENLSRSI